LRSGVTVAPDGNCEIKANGRGRSGGGTAPPLALLPRIVKNNHVSTIAQRLINTDIIDANDVTATS
jgi:hypothetical protein